MSLQWTLVAVFLYSEIAIVIILLLPIISPARWHRFFKSRICQTVSNQANIYFIVFISVLVMFFIDSIREMRKYGATKEQGHGDHSNLDAEIQVSMKLFRSQRNYYIAGFALFLWLVIRRLVTLISSQANLLACCDASEKQARSATAAAERLMKEKEMKEQELSAVAERIENEGNRQREEQEREINELKEELDIAKVELRSSKLDVEAIKQQASSVSREYDRLMEEHAKLQAEVEELTGEETDKKDE